MTTIHDAEPGDIYIDGNGTLWRIVGRCDEPTVYAEAVEETSPNPLYNVVQTFPLAPSSNKRRINGGMNGLMWEGWKRIYRREPAP